MSSHLRISVIYYFHDGLWKDHEVENFKWLLYIFVLDRLNFVQANDNFIEIENMKIVTQLKFYIHMFLKNLINILW